MLPKPRFYTWKELEGMTPLTRMGAFCAMADWQVAERKRREKEEQLQQEMANAS